MSNISPVQFGPRICPGCGHDINEPEDIGSRGCEQCGRTLPHQVQLKRRGHGYDIHIKDSAPSNYSNGEWGHVRQHEGVWGATMNMPSNRDSASVAGHHTRDEAVDAVMRAAGWRGKISRTGYASHYTSSYHDWPR